MAKFDTLLVNSMNVFSPAVGADDDTGTPLDVPLVAVASAVACRLDPKGQGREFVVGKRTAIADFMIFSRAVPGLNESCTIVIGSQTFDVLSVVSEQDGAGAFHHLETFVEEQRA